MSRGLGYVQRRVLEELGKLEPSSRGYGRWTTVTRLALAILGEPNDRGGNNITESHSKSVLRAVHTLALRGLCRTGRTSRYLVFEKGHEQIVVWLTDADSPKTPINVFDSRSLLKPDFKPPRKRSSEAKK